MARQQSRKKSTQPKIGSDPAAMPEAPGDFGVRPDDRNERQYVSQNTKHQDKGGSSQRMRTGDSARESGVGSTSGGRGAGSGGDLDTDIVGVGTGGSGISQSGPDDRTEGADMTTRGGSEPFAAPGPKGHPNAQPSRSKGRGSTVDRSGGDVSTTGAGAGSGAVTNPDPMAQDDDSFDAEISDGEARGGDNSPSDRG
jgi:hypothetical protein